MDAITYRPPVSVVVVNSKESKPPEKECTYCKFCCQNQEEQNALITASLFIDVLSEVVKRLGEQVKTLRKENAELRQQLAAKDRKLDYAA